MTSKAEVIRRLRSYLVIKRDLEHKQHDLAVACVDKQRAENSLPEMAYTERVSTYTLSDPVYKALIKCQECDKMIAAVQRECELLSKELDIVQKWLGMLSYAERIVIEEVYIKPRGMTYVSLGHKLGYSAANINKIRDKALKKIMSL